MYKTIGDLNNDSQNEYKYVNNIFLFNFKLNIFRCDIEFTVKTSKALPLNGFSYSKKFRFRF